MEKVKILSDDSLVNLNVNTLKEQAIKLQNELFQYRNLEKTKILNDVNLNNLHVNKLKKHVIKLQNKLLQYQEFENGVTPVETILKLIKKVH